MTNVKAVPEGFTALTTCLTVKNAPEAIEFYKKAFGATEICRQVMPGTDKIMHAELEIEGAKLMLSEEFPEWGVKSPLALNGTPTYVHIYTADVDSAFQKAIDAGATALMPPGDQFWGDRFGKLQDPYGHQWSIATHIEDVTPEETERRGVEFFASMPKG